MNLANIKMHSVARSTSKLLFFSSMLLMFTACGAGRYGFSKTYLPNAEEKTYHEQSKEFGYTDINSNPADYRNKLISWFGIVRKVTLTDDGRYQVQMSHRKHSDRHLCSSESNSSCRVTVHFKSSGNFSVLLNLKPSDTQAGLDKVQPGSLLRVFGKVRCRENDDEQMECDYDDLGGILLDGEFYRQWPARYFVTTRAVGSMRR